MHNALGTYAYTPTHPDIYTPTRMPAYTHTHTHTHTNTHTYTPTHPPTPPTHLREVPDVDDALGIDEDHLLAVNRDGAAADE